MIDKIWDYTVKHDNEETWFRLIFNPHPPEIGYYLKVQHAHTRDNVRTLTDTCHRLDGDSLKSLWTHIDDMMCHTLREETS